ncbi:MAG: hypothetical protein ABIQ17_02245 [Candidatus Limnocylindrales bacterium]
MTNSFRRMPWAIRGFLAYALLLLAGIGISLPYVVDLAIAAPVSPIGVVVMVLLAYTIFTTTLVLQRKVAARNLALGLASLTIPPALWALTGGLWPVAVFLGALATLLLRGLRSPAATAWLIEP